MPVRRRLYPLSFQSTPSAWRETGYADISLYSISYFNPLPPHGGRPLPYLTLPHLHHFNPLPPHGGRLNQIDVEPIGEDISIHSLRMEGDSQKIVPQLVSHSISIHSLRMEGDCIAKYRSHVLTDISIHSLRMEGDRYKYPKYTVFAIFQSTPSAWRETLVKLIKFWAENISIHSLRMEGDYPQAGTRFLPFYFNPLPPHGGRPQLGW